MSLPYRNIIESSNYAAFGCSHTWGVGVEANETWSYLLGAMNFGVAGCSADYVARTAPKIIFEKKIKVAFVLWPDWTRFDYIDHNGNYLTSLPQDHNRIYYMEKNSKEWLLNNFNQQVNNFRNWCNKNKIKLIDLTLYNLISYIDRADVWPISKLGHHYAPEWHSKVAEIFRNAYENNIEHELRYD